MAKAKRSSIFPTDEELGKRDDDHKPGAASQWVPKTVPTVSFWRKRRLLGLILAVILVYFFVKNMPTDLGPAQTRYSKNMGRAYAPPNGLRPFPGSDQASIAPLPPQDEVVPVTPKAGPKGSAPPAEGGQSILDQTIHSFDGPVRFYYLAASLHAIAKTMGQDDKNKNVMFAASSLKSASAIIPLACEMARWKRNYVHMVLMGRDELPLDDLKTINGVDADTCPIYWHDARPDYAIYSTDSRMGISIAGALKHIHKFMHPQAIITSGSLHEDAFFTRTLHHKTKELKQTLIQLPQEKPHQMSWLTRLDASSLSAWHTATIDLLVQAPSDASGSVIRLLKSLAAADFDGFEPPRLTIELPAKVNDVTSRYLDGFEWPPVKFNSHLRNSQLVLRRRIPEKRVDPEHASIRFIESFYPADVSNSHVLVLSPQAQLSPVFFHTLKYYLLEYKYSESAWMFGDNIFGISLESPSTHLNGTAAFKPPVTPGETVDGQTANGLALYLWQAPNSNAALYFADKWIELHSFLTKHLTAVRHPSTKDHHASRPKLVSPKSPSWTEHFLDLMRTRGYYMLYPSLPLGPSEGSDSTSTPAESLVIVHNELYMPPEEFSSRPIFNQHKDPEQLDADAILDAPAEYLASHKTAKGGSGGLNNESPLLKNLREMVPEPPEDEDEDDDGEDLVASGQGPKPLPMPYSLPLLDHRGDDITHDNMRSSAQEIAADYRRDAGGCPKDQERYVPRIPGSHDADDLFCIDDSGVPDAADDNLDNTPPSPPSTPNNEAVEEERRPPGQAKAKALVPTATANEDQGPFYGKQHHPTGAAATINAATNPADYQTTAAAGMKAKLDAQKAAAEDAAAEFNVPAATDPEEAVNNALPLTPAERAELDDWERAKAKGVGDKPPPDAKGSVEMDELDAKPRSDVDDLGGAVGSGAGAGKLGRLRGWDEGGIDENAPRAKSSQSDASTDNTRAPTQPVGGRGGAGGIGAAMRQANQGAVPVPAPSSAEDDTPLEPDTPTAGKLGRVKGWDVGGLDEAAPRAVRAQADKLAADAAAAAIAAGGSTEGGAEYQQRKKLELDSLAGGAGHVDRDASAESASTAASHDNAPISLEQPDGVGVDTGPEADAEAEEALRLVDEEVRKLGERAKQIQDEDRAAVVSPGDEGSDGETVDRGV